MSEKYKNMDYYELYEYIEKLRKQLEDLAIAQGMVNDGLFSETVNLKSQLELAKVAMATAVIRIDNDFIAIARRMLADALTKIEKIGGMNE